MATQPQRGRTLRRVAGGMAWLALAGVAGFVVYLSTAGFPPWLIDAITRRVNRGDYVVSLSAMRLDIFNGLVVTEPRCFRKKVVGPPVLEAEEIVVMPDVVAWRAGRVPVSRVQVKGGVLRPAMSGPAGTQAIEGVDIRCRLELDSCDAYGFHVREMICDVEGDRRTLALQGVRGTAGAGTDTGRFEGGVSCNLAEGIQRGHVETRFMPRFMFPVFQAWKMPRTIEVLGAFDFRGAPPEVAVDFTRYSDTNGPLLLSGRARIEECSYRGVPVLRSDAKFRVDVTVSNTVVAVDPLYVFREEGTGRGGMTFDFGRQVLHFNGESSLQPLALAAMVDVFPESLLTNLCLTGAAKVSASGRVGLGTNDLLDATARVEGRKIGIRKWVADGCQFYVHAQGVTNAFSGIRGRYLGGTFEGTARVVLPDAANTNGLFAVDGDVRDISLKRLLDVSGRAKDADVTGNLSLKLDLEGPLDPMQPQACRGKGEFRVSKGRLFTMPLFGGMTEIMTKVVPGLDFVLSQSDASAEFRVNNGRIHTDEARIEGDVISVVGRGDYYFDGRLDFKVQVSLLKNKTVLGKAVQLILSPLGWLLEFRLTGTLDEPRWYLRNFSKDLLKKLGLSETDGTGE